MDCQQAESLLALWVGNDLDHAEQSRLLQMHLEACPHCRQRSLEFVVAETALQEARVNGTDGVASESSSLWPRVKARLLEWERCPHFAKFNVWVPTAIATVACSLLVMVASIEVQRRVQGQARNLFVSDPDFNSSRGSRLTREDFERWQDAEFKTVRQVSGPPEF
jgi:hypothetical protein